MTTLCTTTGHDERTGRLNLGSKGCGIRYERSLELHNGSLGSRSGSTRGQHTGEATVRFQCQVIVKSHLQLEMLTTVCHRA